MKKKTKTFLALLTVLVLVGLTACGNKTNVSNNAGGSEALVGGWEISKQDAVVLPDNVKTAFDKVAGDNLVPVALVAQQVVAGTNDMILCLSGNEYRMIVIYRDLQGTATITNNVPFVLTDYTNGGDKVDTTPLAGGWHVPDEKTSIPLSGDAKTAFNNALTSLSGNDIESMALLGTQVVSGTNYAVLCRVTPMGTNTTSSIQVVTIYSDLQKNASFTAFSPIDPKKYSN